MYCGVVLLSTDVIFADNEVPDEDDSNMSYVIPVVQPTTSSDCTTQKSVCK